MKQNKKTFLLSYLIFISMIIIFVIVTSILGNIERKGYLSNFNHILENKYYFTLKFYSSIFKNNKIYRVYPNTNEMPNNVTNIKWSGSYYGNLVLDNDSIQLKKYNKIENIKYKVRIKKDVFLFLIFLIILFPILYYYIMPNIYYHYKSYIAFFILNSFLYLITCNFLMPSFSMMKINFNIYDFLYSYIFTMTAYNLLVYYPFNLNNIKNIRIIFTSLFCIISVFSFFAIESISLTVLNMVILFSDMPNLYASLITVLPMYLKIITITVSIIYFSSIIIFVLLFIFNLYKMFMEKSKIASAVMTAFIIFAVFYLFFKPKNIDIWSIDFVRNANRNGIMNTINYRINYDRLNEIKPSKELVLESINLLKEYESKRDISKLYLKSTKNIFDSIEKLENNINLILIDASSKNTNFIYNNEKIDNAYIDNLKNNYNDIYSNLTNDLEKIEELKKGLKRDVYLIFLESFYDYSHFEKLFNKDPFPREYRRWAKASRKIAPNVNNGSFYARLSGLTGSSPLYPKTQSKKIGNTLPDLLSKNEYYTIALEEALNTYNLKTFYPSIGFDSQVFGLGTTNINTYLITNISNLKSPVFAAGFTILGHTDSHLSNDLHFAENNKKFLDNFAGNDKLHIIETIDNSAMTAISILEIRDTILKHSPNAIIIFKHDHLYPYLKAIIERSSLDEKIKQNFLNDYKPSPILIWDGTNGAYKADENFAPENIPLFIAANLNIDYTNSVISLLYKEEIDNAMSTYNRFYYTTNNSAIDQTEVSNFTIFQYENAQRILSQDIFQGKNHYYDLINTNK